MKRNKIVKEELDYAEKLVEQILSGEVKTEQLNNALSFRLLLCYYRELGMTGGELARKFRLKNRGIALGLCRIC